MGLLDKIKNALFEVEYVEVEDTPKKEKEKDKPIAKKVVLPGKKEQKIEELHEEELRDEDFEIRPRDEAVKEEEVEHDDFKYMDDNDFKVDEDEYLVEEEPQIVQVYDSDHSEILEDEPPKAYPEKEKMNIDYYSNMYAAPPRESKPYGMDRSYNVPVHEYGTYEKKEEKTGFRPSPIISPIYGILDKNYRKEDVKERRDIRITSSYSRSGVSVDEIRNKAYGENQEAPRIERTPVEELKPEVEEPEEENVMVDLNDKAKPEVKEITMGDAVEYYQDLGLEYNVDYVDVSKEKAKKEVVKEEAKEEIQEEAKHEEPKEAKVEEIEEMEEIEEPKAPEKKKNDKESVDDDNLFDLIDSMYQENE